MIGKVTNAQIIDVLQRLAPVGQPCTGRDFIRRVIVASGGPLIMLGTKGWYALDESIKDRVYAVLAAIAPSVFEINLRLEKETDVYDFRHIVDATIKRLSEP